MELFLGCKRACLPALSRSPSSPQGRRRGAGRPRDGWAARAPSRLTARPCPAVRSEGPAAPRLARWGPFLGLVCGGSGLGQEMEPGWNTPAGRRAARRGWFHGERVVGHHTWVQASQTLGRIAAACYRRRIPQWPLRSPAPRLDLLYVLYFASMRQFNAQLTQLVPRSRGQQIEGPHRGVVRQTQGRESSRSRRLTLRCQTSDVWCAICGGEAWLGARVSCARRMRDYASFRRARRGTGVLRRQSTGSQLSSGLILAACS
jgi:hypothetical protein